MNRNINGLYIDELSTFDREQLISNLEVTMISAGYDDIRAEYDERTETVCLTKYGTCWKPVDRQWISMDNIRTSVYFFHKLYDTWIDMSTATEMTEYEPVAVIDNLLFAMLEGGFSNIFVDCSRSIISLNNRKGRTVNIDVSTFPDIKELLNLAYLILRQLSYYTEY